MHYSYKTKGTCSVQIDFDIIADTIKNCGADIIGLQEMRGKGTREDCFRWEHRSCSADNRRHSSF